MLAQLVNRVVGRFRYPAVTLTVVVLVALELVIHGHEVPSAGQIPASYSSVNIIPLPLPDDVPLDAPFLSLSCTSDSCVFTLRAGTSTPNAEEKESQVSVRHAVSAIKNFCLDQEYRVSVEMPSTEGSIRCDRNGGAFRVEECEALFEDLASRAHSLRAAGSSHAHTLMKSIASIAAAHTPSPISRGNGKKRPTDHKPALDTWHAFAEAVTTSPQLSPLLNGWKGKGLVTMAGSVETLPQAIVAVAFMRKRLGTRLPVEIWQSEHEGTTYSPQFVAKLKDLDIVMRSLPKESISPESRKMFSLKPAAILASSFNEVVFFDSDAVITQDPRTILAFRRGNESAVFWPDYWTMLHDATIWDSFPWPYPGKTNGPSQESGLLVVCKTCGDGWKALALAFYLNYHSSVYYEAMYYGHFGETSCLGGPCYRRGEFRHYMPGVGDKDTFIMAWLGMQYPYRMMRPPGLGGNITLNHKTFICGETMIQRGHDGQPVLLHHNSNKWHWHDFAAQKWSNVGFALSHISEFQDDSQGARMDSQNWWESGFYHHHPDAGGDPLPPGTRWCVIYRAPVKTQPLEQKMGWDVSSELKTLHEEMYAQEWLVGWIEGQAGVGEERIVQASTFQKMAVLLILILAVEHLR